MNTSQRVTDIPLSKTIALDTRAKELIAAGQDVINVAVGEPDFPTPRAARRAAEELVAKGIVRYTPAAGTVTLRKAIAAHLAATRGVEYDVSEIAVCGSAKHALSGVFFALLDPGDEVLLPLPAWVSYVEQVRFAGGVPVEVAPHPDLSPDVEGLRAAVTPRTKGIVLNSPSNPTGYVWTRAEIEALVALAEEHDLWILSDEIYRRLVYEGEPNVSPVEVSRAARERTIIVDGASKSYAMTGWRIGYLAGPREVAAGVARLHSQLTGCPSTVSQVAYEACLHGEPPEVAEMCAEFDRRRRRLLAGLAELGLETPTPRGAFYAFPDVRPWLDGRGVAGFCEDLLEEQGVACVPGTAFGTEGYARFSYAIAFDRLEEMLARLGAFLEARKAGV